MRAFSFLQITDHHLYASEDQLRLGLSPAVRFRAVLRQIADRHAAAIDFIVSTGDLVENPTRSSYQALRRMLGLAEGEDAAHPPGPLLVTAEGLAGCPLYVLPGNHDDPTLLQQELFPGAPVRAAYNFGFRHEGVQFLCLDWGNTSRAELKPETLSFLEERLAGDEPSVLLTHHLFAPVGAGWLDNLMPADLEPFWSVIKGKSVLGILSGHAHISEDAIAHGIPVLGLRATAFSFARTERPLIGLEVPQYRFLTVHQGVLTSRLFDVPLR